MLSHRSTVRATPCTYPDIEAYFVPAENFLPLWHSFALHPQLYAALHSQNFVGPTPIQSQAIPKASSGRDVIGVAETVSGHYFSYLTYPYL
jgi:superfamily II DNA/RNA helicase